MYDIPISVKTFIAALAELAKELDPSLQAEVNKVGGYLSDSPDLAKNELTRISKKNDDLYLHYQSATEIFAEFYFPQAKDKVLNPEETQESIFHDEYDEVSNISGFPEDIDISVFPSTNRRPEESKIVSILMSKNSVEAAKKAKKTLIPKGRSVEEQTYIWAYIYLR